MAELGGRPLLIHALDTMRAACERVIVVLGARADEIQGRLALDDVVVCPDWEQGIFASLQCGLAALGDEYDAIVVALGDQPFLTQERIDAVLAVDAPIARARDGDAPSHPVVIRRGARLTHPAMREAPGVELGPLQDIDTPEALRAARG